MELQYEREGLRELFPVQFLNQLRCLCQRRKHPAIMALVAKIQTLLFSIFQLLLRRIISANAIFPRNSRKRFCLRKICKFD